MRKRLLIVMPVFLPEGLGGAERQCSILAPALVALGWEVEILTPTTDPGLPGCEKAYGALVTRLSVKAFPNLGGRQFLSFLSWTVRAFLWIARRRSRFDAIYVFHARLQATPVALAARVFGIPLIVKLGRGGESFDFSSLTKKKYVYGSLALWLIRTATRGYIANSLEIAGDLRTAGIEQDRIHMIPNGVILPDEAGIENATAARGGNVLLYAGRLAPEKNINLLIEAFGAVAPLWEGLELWIAGDGPLSSALRARAIEIGKAGGQVHFLGQISDMASVYEKADFFVSASDAEGQSNALLEAMAHGLIPLVCRASGTSSLIDQEITGFQFEGPDLHALIEALTAARGLTQPARLDMARSARRRVGAIASIAAVAAAQDELLSNIVEVP